MYFIDSHAHLDDKKYQNELTEIIQRANSSQIRFIITIAENLNSTKNAAIIAQKYPEVFFTMGVHPHAAKSIGQRDMLEFEIFSQNPKMVAIGEIGLDYHYNYSPPDIQVDIFRKFMAIAAKLKLPVVIHMRESEIDTLNILKEYKNKVIGVMHCFSGNKQTMFHCLDLGYYISIAGPITFKKSFELEKLLREIPDDRLLIETDAPYLAPVPYRGKRNEPAYLIYTARKIAQLKNISIEQLADSTARNTNRLFRLPNS